MPLLFCTLYWPVIYQLCSVFGVVLMFLQISLQRPSFIMAVFYGGRVAITLPYLTLPYRVSLLV